MRIRLASLGKAVFIISLVLLISKISKGCSNDPAWNSLPIVCYKCNCNTGYLAKDYKNLRYYHPNNWDGTGNECLVALNLRKVKALEKAVEKNILIQSD